MKTYYQKLGPIVLPFLRSFQNDYLIHDKKALENYTGEFLYAIRETGTDIFCFNEFESALEKLIYGKENGFFTSRGFENLFYGKLKAEDATYSLAGIFYKGYRNQRFFIGKNGRVKEYSRSEFLKLAYKRLEKTQMLIDQLKGSPLVYMLIEKTRKVEEKERA